MSGLCGELLGRRGDMAEAVGELHRVLKAAALAAQDKVGARGTWCVWCSRGRP